MKQIVAGFWPLFRANVRYESWFAAPWILAIAGLSASSAGSFESVLPDVASRRDMELTIRSNPAFNLIFGPLGDLSTPDGFTAWHALTLGGLFTALMAIMLVVRASRAAEDSGQAELIASGVVGRGTRLLVAEAVAAVASLAVGAVSLGATLLAGGTLAPTAVLAAGWTATGLAFAAVAAIAVQIGASAPTARALALGVTGVLCMARGWVDASDTPSWAVWITPFGWVQQTRPAVDNRWWPLLAVVGLAAVASGIAHTLNARRDFGFGILAPRQGAARAGVVATLPGFTWRLHRSALVAWLVALTLLGAELGNVATSIGPLITANPELGRIIAAGATSEKQITAAFILLVVSLLGMIAALPGIQVIVRVASDENNHLVEPVLATAVHRFTYLAQPVALALLASGLAMLLGGAGMTVVAAANDIPLTPGEMLRQSAVALPAVWSLVALAVAAVGIARPLAVLGWAGAAAAFALTILGPLFKLDEAILRISPFWHVPNVVAADLDVTATGIVGLLALALIAIGFVGFRRRDLH